MCFNYIITEIARCVEFCHMSSEWFDCTDVTMTHHSAMALQSKAHTSRRALGLGEGEPHWSS